MIRTAENCIQALLARNGFSGSKIVKYFFIKKKAFLKSEHKAGSVGVVSTGENKSITQSRCDPVFTENRKLVRFSDIKHLMRDFSIPSALNVLNLGFSLGLLSNSISLIWL